jgi:ankyrin repeat protein
MSKQAESYVLLFEHIRDGEMNAIRELCARKPGVIDSRNEEGETPLHWASDFGETECAEYLLERGGDVNAMTKSGSTPLHYACREGSTDIAQMLLDKGAYVSIGNKLKWHPVHWACFREFYDIVEMLVTWKADFNTINANGFTPLHYLARIPVERATPAPGSEGYVDEVTAKEHGSCVTRVLAKEGGRANPSVKDKYGLSALHHAVTARNLALVKTLVDAGANVNSIDEKDETPFFLACRLKLMDIAHLLICRGADSKAREDDDVWLPSHDQWAGPGPNEKPLLGLPCRTLAVHNPLAN